MLVSYIYPGPKSPMTIRSCSFSHVHMSSYILISFRYFITFATSHSLPNIFFISPSMQCFLLSSLHWGKSWRQCFSVVLWLSHAALLHVGCCSLLDIKCLGSVWYVLFGVSSVWLRIAYNCCGCFPTLQFGVLWFLVCWCCLPTPSAIRSSLLSLWFGSSLCRVIWL